MEITPEVAQKLRELQNSVLELQKLMKSRSGDEQQLFALSITSCERGSCNEK